MTASLLYRIAAVLLVLFAAGHTLGFRSTNGMGSAAETVASTMRSTTFTVPGAGAPRSYWGFFVGFGLFVTAFLLFSAVLSWQLGGLPNETLARLTAVTWTFAACFLFVAVLSWTKFFAIPAIFASAVTACLGAAAWVAGRSG